MIDTLGRSTNHDVRLRALVSHEFTVLGGPNAPSEARQTLVARLAGGVRGDAFESLRLLLSEVVTNCVLHGGAHDGRPIDVRVAVMSRLACVEVSSDGPSFAHCTRRPDHDDPSGRGLFLVAALSERWGIEVEPRASVWFQVRL